jgi:hypothetical protein
MHRKSSNRSGGQASFAVDTPQPFLFGELDGAAAALRAPKRRRLNPDEATDNSKRRPMTDKKRFTEMDVKDPNFIKSLQLEPVIIGARVDWVRSEDHHVYLTSQHTRGWAWMDDPFTFAIMAAASAADITVSFKARRYDPEWGGGAGLFEGVHHVRFSSTPI